MKAENDRGRENAGRQQSAVNVQQSTVEAFYVFCKAKSNGTQTYEEMVEAVEPEDALRQALDHYRGKRLPFAWWVIPVRQVIKSDPADVDSLFAPALDKPFRLSTDFHTVTAMRHLKTGEQDARKR